MNLQEQIKAGIAIIREQAKSFLIDECTLYHKTGETVTKGQAVNIYATPQVVPCRLIVRSGTESINLAAQERATQLSTFYGVYRLQIPVGTIVSVGDKIDFTDKANGVVHNFEVVFVPPNNEFTGAYTIGLQEIQ